MFAFTVKVVPYHGNHHVSKGATFTLEANIPVSSLFHSVTTTAQQVVGEYLQTSHHLPCKLQATTQIWHQSNQSQGFCCSTFFPSNLEDAWALHAQLITYLFISFNHLAHLLGIHCDILNLTLRITHVLKHGSPDRRVIPMITFWEKN